MPSMPYYLRDSGVLHCEDCAPDGADAVPHGETDAPSHCDECGALLDESLTPHGVAYVLDALADYMSAAVFTTADGRAKHGGAADTLDDWRAEYGDVLASARRRGVVPYESGDKDGETYGERVLRAFDAVRERQTSALGDVLTLDAIRRAAL